MKKLTNNLTATDSSNGGLLVNPKKYIEFLGTIFASIILRRAKDKEVFCINVYGDTPPEKRIFYTLYFRFD